MRIAAAFVNLALIFSTLASGTDFASPVQYPPPRVSPPIQRPIPHRAPVWVSPAPVCDVALKTPTYPASAIANGEEGTVELLMFVGRTGKITEAQIRQSSGSPALDAAVMEATESWLMEPGTENGSPVAVWGLVVVVFRLESGPPQEAKVEVTFPNGHARERCIL